MTAAHEKRRRNTYAFAMRPVIFFLLTDSGDYGQSNNYRVVKCLRFFLAYKFRNCRQPLLEVVACWMGLLLARPQNRWYRLIDYSQKQLQVEEGVRL